MKKLTSKGFSVIEILVIIAVIGVLGLVGWFAYSRLTKKDASTVSTTTPESVATDADDETASWTTVTTMNNGFTIKLPPGWMVQNFQTEDILRGNDVSPAETVAVVEEVPPYAGDAQFTFTAGIYTGETGTPMTGSTETAISNASGEGKKYSYTYPADTEDLIGARKKGDKEYQYRFSVSGSRTLLVTYNVNVGEEDLSATVDKVVQTIKLN